MIPTRLIATYKTHTVATHHGGSGQPSDRDINAHEITDTEIEHAQEFNHVNTNDFKELEPNNPARLTTTTRDLDDLHQVQAGEVQPSEALNCIGCKLQTLYISLYPSAPPEPLEDVLKHYTDTLCSAQKQTNFTTSLLQDILIFTGHDPTDWLMDIETVADLTLESRPKLSEAKLKGLTCTLITEAITSRKSWDDIKDLLWLKYVIPISTHPYPISWRFNKRKKPVIACIHHFKREAKRCNFRNNATSIQICIKGLKMHII